MSNSSWNPDASVSDLEDHTTAKIAGIRLPSPEQFVRDLRAYLQIKIDRGRRLKSGVELVHLYRPPKEDVDCQQIDAGPGHLNPSSTDPWMCLRSGAKLALGITLRRRTTDSELLAYRFHLEVPHSRVLTYVRIDLNKPKDGYDPLHQPRSHMHPGAEIHLPFPAMHPLGVLDRIIDVIEPHFAE